MNNHKSSSKAVSINIQTQPLVEMSSTLLALARVAPKATKRGISEQLCSCVTLGRIVESKLTRSDIFEPMSGRFKYCRG